MNNHLKSILKVCGIVGLICLVTVLSCLPFVNFDNNKVELHADQFFENYSFQSSNIAIPITFYNQNLSEPTSNYNDIALNQFMGVSLFWSTSSLGVEIQMPTALLIRSIDNLSNDGYWHNTSFVTNVYSPNDIKCFIAYNFSSSFDGDVVSINISSRDNFAQNTSLRGSKITLISRNGSTFQFVACYVPKFTEGVEFNFLDERVYYLTSTFSDNESYQQGYSAGQSSGYNSGYSTGYSSGYDNGYDVGKLAGYNDGLNEQDIYTFGNLLTAVIDAPVGVFISMLDFNIMGFNLLNLVVGLLTLAVICLVIKLMLGGK